MEDRPENGENIPLPSESVSTTPPGGTDSSTTERRRGLPRTSRGDVHSGGRGLSVDEVRTSEGYPLESSEGISISSGGWGSSPTSGSRGIFPTFTSSTESPSSGDYRGGWGPVAYARPSGVSSSFSTSSGGWGTSTGSRIPIESRSSHPPSGPGGWGSTHQTNQRSGPSWGAATRISGPIHESSTSFRSRDDPVIWNAPIGIPREERRGTEDIHAIIRGMERYVEMLRQMAERYESKEEENRILRDYIHELKRRLGEE